MLEEDRILGMCIMADVIASRKMDKKDELKHIVNALNESFHEGLITNFTIRSGDEIFGVLRTFSDSYKVLKLMQQLSDEWSVPLYVGLGFGFINNRDLANPHEINGRAIWDAADALNRLKKERGSTHKGVDARKTFKFYFYTSSHIPYQVVNYQVYFLFERLHKRTDKQREVIETVEKLTNTKSYDEIGELLGYDKFPSTNVSKILSRADFQLVSDAEKSLYELLDYYQQQLLTSEVIRRD